MDAPVLIWRSVDCERQKHADCIARQLDLDAVCSCRCHPKGTKR